MICVPAVVAVVIIMAVVMTLSVVVVGEEFMVDLTLSIRRQSKQQEHF